MTRVRALAAAFVVTLLVQGCGSTPKTGEPRVGDKMEGLASWYGQEYAGHITANGEIFDPTALTAAHRTLPFGTVVRVADPQGGRSVEVRINDRGPFIGGRVIDLSYAAAEALGMIDAGVLPVRMTVVKLGRGELEPPVPYVVAVAAPPPSAAIPTIADVPPPPEPPPASTPPPAPEELVDVEVVEERGGQPVRRQTSSDGTTIETVPIPPQAAAATTAAATPPPPPTASRPTTSPSPSVRKWSVQLGAFRSEENAGALRSKAAAIVSPAFVSPNDQGLFRVRVGPFASRTEAVDARATLEKAGLSGWIASD